MAKINNDIKNNYDEYLLHIECPKHIADNFIVSHKKDNHPESYYDTENVSGTIDFGNTVLGCEIRERNEYNYSITYLTDRIADRVLYRLDVGNGTHRNVAPDIPLEQSSVLTPHYHKYRSDGRLLAYPLDGVDYESEDSLKLGLADGYAYICNELNISTANTLKPQIGFAPNGAYVITEVDIDPNQDVEF